MPLGQVTMNLTNSGVEYRRDHEYIPHKELFAGDILYAWVFRIVYKGMPYYGQTGFGRLLHQFLSLGCPCSVNTGAPAEMGKTFFIRIKLVIGIRIDALMGSEYH